MFFDEETELKNWRDAECICIKGSSNTNCPCHNIIHTLMKKVSFATFLSFVKKTPSIARLSSNLQDYKGHLMFTSKCNSGRFYRKMSHKAPDHIKKNPQLYEDSDDEAAGLSSDGEQGIATDTYDYLPEDSDEEKPEPPDSPSRPNPTTHPKLHARRMRVYRHKRTKARKSAY
jgi:hypothetical protein